MSGKIKKSGFGSKLFVVSVLVLASLSLVYALSSNPDPGHTWNEVACDSNLCVDDINGKVGVGKTNPAQKLDVVGNIKASGTICDGTGKCLDTVSGGDTAKYISSPDNGAGSLALGSQQGLLTGYPTGYYPTLKGNPYVYLDMNNDYIGYFSSDGLYMRPGNYIYASRLYDSDSTGYYVDPASNSVMNTINGYTFNQDVSQFSNPTFSNLYFSQGDIRVDGGLFVRNVADNDYRKVVAAVYEGPLTNNGAYIKARSGNQISFNWDGSLRFYVDSTLVKTFVIDNPVDSSKYLVHGTLEGPEGAVFYRGEAKLEDGVAEVELPHYFEALTREEGRTVLLTVKDGWSPLYVDGEVADGKFIVKTTGEGDSEQAFYWEVKAVRADVSPLVVEPSKADVAVEGIGPYTYAVQK